MFIKSMIPNIYTFSRKLYSNKFHESVKWARMKPLKFSKNSSKTVGQQRKDYAERERIWGNRMIGKHGNRNWSGILGQNIVKEVLTKLGEKPKKRVIKKGGFQPDIETEKYIYEVKTSNWTINGTAGEKVLGTFIKYQNIPDIYGKPLRIICVAYQEYELTHGKTKFFGSQVTPKTKQLLDLAKSWGIEYIKFSDLVAPLLVIDDDLFCF